MKKIILTVLLMFISTTVTLGQEEWELPRSWQERDLRPIEKVEVLEHLSDSVIKYWDDYWETREFQLWAYPHYLNYTLENSGQWETLKDGSKVWRLAIVIPKDIELLNIYFDTFLMAKDSKFYIWSYSNKELIDNISYEKKQKQREQRLAVEKKLDTKLDSTWETKHGTVINKKLDTLIFEYNIPYRVLDIGKISLHGLNEQRPKNIGLNTTNNNDCHVNVNCIEGYDWHKEKNAVVKIIVNDVSSFTGALVNNTDNDYIPYVLTTKHAVDELSKLSEPISITSLKFQWNYDSDTCGEDVFLHTSVITGGRAILIASTETENNSDFVLLLLNEDPKDVAGIDLYYLGWDSNESIGNTGVGIHHPKGKTKKIATVKQNSIVSDLNHNYWRVQWEETVNGYDITENFSSGSPLLNENHRVIGQLRGGTSIVTNICDSAVYKKSYYGKFSVSWDNDTSISKQLKYWLDPNNTNVSVCDGTEYFPCLVGKSPFLTNRIITGNVSINTPIYSAGDITIKNGGTLNITSTLHMAPNTQIIVERGGQLNVTNGTITNACENEYWAGVEVQGSEDNQTLSNQGKVTLNNAKVENAQYAFFLFTGAILKGYKSSFTNNQVSISMMDYPNENINTLNQCTFTWNTDMIEHEQTELRHISMYGMEGIKFYGCTFNNQLTDTTIITYGIDAIETGIIVNYAPEFIRPIFSKFNGLTYGINDLSILTKTCTINNAIFTDNTFGIHATGSIGGLQITKDTFNINPRGVEHLFMAGTPIEAEAIGVIIDDSHGFTVQGNEFLGKGSTYYAVGLQISNTNGYDDIVRNNTFNNLYAGTQALGINCAMQGNLDNITQQGLEYRCNNFAKNIFGIYVNGYGYENSGRKIVGIKQSQGTITQPAYNYSTGNAFDLANFNADTIHYWIYEDDGEINTVGNVEQDTTTNAGVNCNKLKLNLLNSENIAEIDNVLDIQEEENEKIFEDKLDMVEIYLAQKDYEQARNVLNTITDEENEDEIYDYIDYINYLEEYKNLYNIPTELLMDMESHSTRVGQHVRDIFSFKKIRNTDHPKVFIADMEEINQMIENKNSKKETTLKDNISITPNPASTEIELVYLFMENGTYTLSIKDINGNEVIKATLSKDNGKQTININNLSTGIYYYTVTKNSTIIKSDKLVVVK